MNMFTVLARVPGIADFDMGWYSGDLNAVIHLAWHEWTVMYHKGWPKKEVRLRPDCQIIVTRRMTNVPPENIHAN